MCILTDNSEKGIPAHAEPVSDNRISSVWATPSWIYKRSIPFLIENEFGIWKIMQYTGFVPYMERYDKYTLRIENLGKSDRIVVPQLFKERCLRLLDVMKEEGVRHGDLTTPHIIVKTDHPFVIDWAESRLAGDSRPDKRPEGDKYWLEKTIEELINGST